MGAEPSDRFSTLRPADDLPGSHNLSTGNRAIDLLLQQPHAELPPVAASRAANGKAAVEEAAMSAKQAPSDDGAKLAREALLREAALFVEQQEHKQGRAARTAYGTEPEAMAARASPSGRDASANGPAALEGWRATVKELALALRENREWIIGIAVLIAVGVLSIRTLGAFGMGRGGQSSGRHHAGRR